MSGNTFYQNLVFNGLGTLSVTVPNAGPYEVNVQSTIPTLVNGGGVSALVITIEQNGTPVLTGIAGATGAQANIACAAADVIAVVFSSAASPDQGLNVIKSAVSISQGAF